MFYGAVAAFGLTAIQDLLLGQSTCCASSGESSCYILALKPFSPNLPKGRRVTARRVVRRILTPSSDHHHPITILSSLPSLPAGLPFHAVSGGFARAR